MKETYHTTYIEVNGESGDVTMKHSVEAEKITRGTIFRVSRGIKRVNRIIIINNDEQIILNFNMNENEWEVERCSDERETDYHKLAIAGTETRFIVYNAITSVLGSKNNLSQKTKEKIELLRQRGLECAEISNILGISVKTIHNIINEK